jgi:hypothetical protein
MAQQMNWADLPCMAAAGQLSRPTLYGSAGELGDLPCMAPAGQLGRPTLYGSAGELVRPTLYGSIRSTGQA